MKAIKNLLFFAVVSVGSFCSVMAFRSMLSFSRAASIRVRAFCSSGRIGGLELSKLTLPKEAIEELLTYKPVELENVINALESRRNHLISLNPPNLPVFLKGKILSCDEDRIVWKDQSVTKLHADYDRWYGRGDIPCFSATIKVGPLECTIYDPCPEDNYLTGVDELCSEWAKNGVKDPSDVVGVVIWWFNTFGHKNVDSDLHDSLVNKLELFLEEEEDDKLFCTVYINDGTASFTISIGWDISSFCIVLTNPFSYDTTDLVHYVVEFGRNILVWCLDWLLIYF